MGPKCLKSGIQLVALWVQFKKKSGTLNFFREIIFWQGELRPVRTSVVSARIYRALHHTKRCDCHSPDQERIGVADT